MRAYGPAGENRLNVESGKQAGKRTRLRNPNLELRKSGNRILEFLSPRFPIPPFSTFPAFHIPHAS